MKIKTMSLKLIRFMPALLNKFHLMLIVPAIEFGGFCAENRKWVSAYFRRAELGEHFNGSLYFGLYIPMSFL
jgi:hypothetical protein